MDGSQTKYDVERISASAIELGDRVRLIGNIYFTVEWKGVDADADSVILAGTTSNGRPHASSLGELAKVDRLIGEMK